MPQRDVENLFRRFKGELVNIRSVSGEVYKGHVSEITNDYVLLSHRDTEPEAQTFVFFTAIESVVVGQAT